MPSIRSMDAKSQKFIGIPWPPKAGKSIMHFAKHTKYASEQTCKHPLSMRTLHAGCQLSPLFLSLRVNPPRKKGAQTERNSSVS